MRKVLKCGLFFVILFLIINVISYFLLFDKNVEKFGLYKIANYSILSENKNSIDAVVIGDSLIYSSVSPMEIWHNYGYSVYDCASAAQLLKDSYDNLKVALENQDLKVVFLEANVLYRNPKNKSWYFKVYNLIIGKNCF